MRELLYLRVRRCRFKCVVRVKLAEQCGQSLDLGRTGTLPLCDRIFDAVPSFLRSMFDIELDDGPGADSGDSEVSTGGLSLVMLGMMAVVGRS